MKAPYVGGNGKWISVEEDELLSKQKRELDFRLQAIRQHRKSIEAALSVLDEDIAQIEHLLDMTKEFPR